MLAIAPIAWTVAHVARHAVAVPVHDEWQVQVPVAIRAAAGTLRAQDLLAPHMEHRYVLTRLLTAGNAWLLGWDRRLELFVNLALVLLTLLLLLDLVRRQRPEAAGLAAALFSALLFSPRQRWLWGLMSASMGVVLLLTLAVVTLTRRPPSWARLSVAMALAALATWSAGPGVALWPALAAVGWLAGYRRPAHAAGLVGAGVLTVALWLVGFEGPTHAAAGPIETARYTLAFLAAPLVPESARWMRVATGLGALGLASAGGAAWVLGRDGRGLGPAAPWLGLCVFSLGAAVLAAFTRAAILETVPFQPLRARYVTLATPFWVGLAALALLTIGRPPRRTLVARIGPLLLVTLAPFYLLAAVRAARAPVVPTVAHERCLEAFPRSRDSTCLADVVYGIRAVQPRIDDLARLRLGVFRR